MSSMIVTLLMFWIVSRMVRCLPCLSRSSVGSISLNCIFG